MASPFAATADSGLMQLETRAAGGDADAQYHLGLAYRSGTEELPADPSRAIYWFKKAAAQCNAPALDMLGRFYHAGTGVRADDKTAARYFRLAAAQKYPQGVFDWGMSLVENRAFLVDATQDAAAAAGCAVLGPEALASIGSAHGSQTLFSSDPEQLKNEGVHNVEYAANQGLPAAQYTMGTFFENGIGVQRDSAKAAEWYKKAAGNGDEDATKRLQAMEPSATH